MSIKKVMQEKTWTKAEVEAAEAGINWGLINSLTDEELDARAKADDDYFEPTAAEWAKARLQRDNRIFAMKTAAE